VSDTLGLPVCLTQMPTMKQMPLGIITFLL